MLSIKKLLEGERPGRAPDPEPAPKLARMILHAIAAHAVEFNRLDADHFRAQMERFAARLDDRLEPGEILVLAGSLTEALTEYNHRLTQFLGHRSTEFQTMVGMFSDAIAEMSGGCDQTVSKLKSIESRMHEACEIDDIRELRGQLRTCLSELMLERARHEEENSPFLQALRRRMTKAAAVYSMDPDIDPCTGLPSRAMAERAMAEPFPPEDSAGVPFAAQSGMQRYAAIFVVERVQLVKMRFGGDVGDELLLTFAQQLAQGLTNVDRCYRWTGPALVAILERSHSLSVVRSEIGRMLPTKLEKTFRVGSRSVLIPISSNWTVAPLQGRQLPETLLKLDSFVTEHAPEAVSA